MTKLYKVYISDKQDQSIKDFWLVLAKDVQSALAKARNKTADDYQLDGIEPIYGDVIR